MRVVVISKTPFNVVTYNNVTSISISGTNYVINDGTAHTYPIAQYKIAIV